MHLSKNELCLDFYRGEIALLAPPNWNPTATAGNISKRVEAMKRNLKDRKEREDNCGGCISFETELSDVMTHFCCKCAILGPLLEEEAHRLTCVGMDDNGLAVWHCTAQCTACIDGDSPDFYKIKEKLKADTLRLRGSEDD